MPVLPHEELIDDAVASYAEVYGLQNCEAELSARLSTAVAIAKQRASQAAFHLNNGERQPREQIGRQKPVK